MARWGLNFFLREKVIKQKEILNALKSKKDDDRIQLYFDKKEKLNELLMYEAIYWKQRAKVFWSEEGDTNSNFFML